MSDPQRKEKGKTTTSKRKRGESSMPILDILHDDSWREKHFTPQEKAYQLLTANDPVKFGNRYCELKYPVFATSRNLYLERTLKISKELQQYTSEQIKQRGWFFLERNLTEVNGSWVREFYCNYFKTSLDAVHLRGKQILVTKEAIEDILHLQPKSDQPDDYQKAEEDMRFMRFDWDDVKQRIALDPTVPWVMGKNTVMPKGIKLIYLNDEARLWYQILSNYVMPSTHETELPAAMITLIWSVMEGKDLYLPRFIRYYMARVHVRGTLPFPYLVTQLGRRADVPWELADEISPAADCKKIIPHNRKFQALGYRPPFLTASDETATPSAAPSSSTAAPATTTAPPPALEPIYHFVHRLFQQLDQMERRNQRRYERSERRNQRRYEHLKLMIRSGGDIPSEPDTPSDTSEVEEDNHEEETPTQAEQAGPKQTTPHHEEHHQLQAADPEIPLQSVPPLQQTDLPTLIQPADPQATIETPAAHPSGDDTHSHSA
ncbi:uncharacterized protein DS421_12g365580 [Arachis hypogaea]|nr:uncharacterized protein DS421_12g365580 [Arachis hypogaea]